MSKRFQIKKVFTSLFVSYLIMLILPGAFIWKLYDKAYNLTMENYINDSINFLSQAAAGFDKYIESLDERSVRLACDTNLKAMMKIRKPQPAESTVYNIVRFSNELYEKLSYIDKNMGYFVILGDNEFIFTENTVVYGLKYYFDNFRTYQSITYDEWYEQVFYTNNRILFPMRTIQINGRSVDAITYNYPIKGGNNWSTKGVVQFLIRREYLEDLFSQINQENGEIAFILDDIGDIIACIGDQSKISSKDLTEMEEHKGYFFSTDGNSKNIVVYTKSSENGLIFASYLPEEAVMMKMRDVKHYAILSILICLTIEIFICITFSWKYAEPINNIIKNLRAIYANDRNNISVSQYEYLAQGVTHLINNNRSMQSDIEKQHIEMRRYFINHLLEGQFKDKEDIKRLARQAGISLDKRMYCAATFEIGNQAKEIIDTLMEKIDKDHDERVLFAHVYNQGTITVLFGFEDTEIQKNREYIYATLIALNEEVYRLMNRYANIGVGKPYNDIMDIPFSFTQSCCSATSDYERHDGFIIEYESVSQNIGNMYYPIELELKLINSTKYGDTKQVRSIFQEILKKNVEIHNLSTMMRHMLIENIQATLLRVYSDVVSDKRLNDIIELPHKHTELPDALKELENQFVSVAEYVERSKTERVAVLKRNMEQYIKQNYKNSMLSMTSMADYFALSEAYFSQLFKEIIGDSFSTYLETMRLEKSKELLLGNKLTIEQIASAVGYNNSSTYRRAFKRVVGISPSTYKEKKENEMKGI